jgi:hypothetical protein
MTIQPTAGEILGAFQIGVIDRDEARVLLGLKPKPAEETTEGNE